MKKIFISYSSEDLKTALQVCEYLESKQLSCFVAARDIVAGKNYPEEIVRMLTECDCIVLVLTRKSNQSINVVNEIERGFNLKKTIILFRVENIQLSTSLEYFLASFHWLDAFESRPGAYFEKLFCSIQDLPLPPLQKKYVLTKKIALNLLLFYLAGTLVFAVVWGRDIFNNNAFAGKKNFNGIRFADAVKSAGMEDIEDRYAFPTPPRQIYQSAKREIFISGTSNQYTLQNFKNTLDSAMKRGIKVRLLFLDPHSADTMTIKKANNHESYSLNFNLVMTILRNDTSFYTDSNLSIKFVRKMLPFQGIMIDGDIEHIEKPRDDNGFVRIANYLSSPSHHDWITQFHRVEGMHTAYTDYSTEFRYIWNFVAQPHKEYYE